MIVCVLFCVCMYFVVVCFASMFESVLSMCGVCVFYFIVFGISMGLLDLASMK